ncbi:MAG: LysM peptidoglycan-binding domain-containing protein [Bacteroidetes bacterium]|nr:LysM peptidoglycan-binding domain-containing protein [Bacteroidota bacterium]
MLYQRNIRRQLQKLCQLNNINESEKIRLGQKLRINNKCD